MNNISTSDIMGILGTVIGTFLGWSLNNISRRGKIKIFISDFTGEYVNKIDSLVQVISANSNKVENSPDDYNYDLSLDLYNSSDDIRIMRDIKIVFLNQKEVIYTDIPKDKSKTMSNHQSIEVSPINVPPKSVLKLDLVGHCDINLIKNVTKICLEYVNNKNKKKTVLIKKENYNNFFENHKQ